MCALYVRLRSWFLSVWHRLLQPYVSAQMNLNNKRLVELGLFVIMGADSGPVTVVYLLFILCVRRSSLLPKEGWGGTTRQQSLLCALASLSFRRACKINTQIRTSLLHYVAAVNISGMYANCHLTYPVVCFNVQGKLLDGKVFDSSLSREPLVVELGKRTVIAGNLSFDQFLLLNQWLAFIR